MLRTYYRIPEAIGIHIRQGVGEEIRISACGVRAERHMLDITFKKENIASLKELAGKVSDLKIPVSLVYSGRSVLIRPIENIDDRNDDALFASVMLDAAIEDFYVQSFRSGNSNWLAIVRRSAIDPLLKELQELGFNVLLLSLGPFSLYPVLPQLNFYGNIVQLDDIYIERTDNGEWLQSRNEQGSKADFPIKLGEEKISETLVVPYSAAFQLVMASQLSPISATVLALAIKLKDELLVRKYRTIGILALGLLFLLLVINFFTFDHYQKENERLALQIGQRDRDLTGEAQIETRLKEKEKLLDSLGYAGGHDQSRMVDQMASLLTTEVTWEKVEVGPLIAGSSGSTGTPHFNDREIRIKGRSEKIIAVNEWIARLHEQKWVKAVRLLDYQYNNELKTGQFNVLVQY